MGRELQKKKNKSSISKARPKVNGRTKAGKKKVNFLGSETIAKNWDRKLTLAQNYERLGLSTRLGAATGGKEKLGKENKAPQSGGSLSIPQSRNTGKLTPQEVRVERDSSGKIIRVVRPEEEEASSNPLNDPLNNMVDMDYSQPDLATTEVVAELEREAAKEAELLAKNKRPRQQSQREEEWMASLVQKHGNDLKAMARDRKLNPMQQTEGDIGRRLRKWQASTKVLD